MYSGYTSVSSFSSVASTSTGGSSRRMIIPLYNLQAHNVMANVIVDAGTDAKIARFARRGMELIGLAVLEPMEVFGLNSSLTTPAVSLPTSNPRRSIDTPTDTLSAHDRPETPTSSSYSISSAGLDHQSPSAVAPSAIAPLSPPAETPRQKRIFSKLFKRKDGSATGHSPAASISSPPVSPSPTNSTFLKPVPRARTLNASAHSKRSSVLSDGGDVPPPSPGMVIALQPAVLGIQPSLNSPYNPPHGRPHSYAWIVRKWIKGSNSGLLNNMMGMMNISGDERRRSVQPPQGELPGLVEVQFIWSRGKTKGGVKKSRSRVKREGTIDSVAGTAGLGRRSSRRESTGLSSGTPSATSLREAAPSPVRTSPGPSRKEKRMSTVSIGTNTEEAGSDTEGASPSAGDGTRRLQGEEDDGNESDPEDSETPWTCVLSVRRPDSDHGNSRIKIKVATLSPTPHHPKVVSLLKIPFPLPDIVVETMEVRKRAVTPQGIARPNWNEDADAGLVLTAEEIKDIASSTALWLVVREGIGGVGKVNRKGDGWRIRA